MTYSPRCVRCGVTFLHVEHYLSHSRACPDRADRLRRAIRALHPSTIAAPRLTPRVEQRPPAPVVPISTRAGGTSATDMERSR